MYLHAVLYIYWKDEISPGGGRPDHFTEFLAPAYLSHSHSVDTHVGRDDSFFNELIVKSSLSIPRGQSFNLKFCYGGEMSRIYFKFNLNKEEFNWETE